jgi:hypothetical protein
MIHEDNNKTARKINGLDLSGVFKVSLLCMRSFTLLNFLNIRDLTVLLEIFRAYQFYSLAALISLLI